MSAEEHCCRAEWLRTFLKRWFLWQLVFMALQIPLLFNATGEAAHLGRTFRDSVKFFYGPGMAFVQSVIDAGGSNRSLAVVLLALLYAVPPGAAAAALQLRLRRGSRHRDACEKDRSPAATEGGSGESVRRGRS